MLTKADYINTYGFSNFSGGDKIGIGSDGTLVVDEQHPIGVAVVVDGINQIYIF